MEPQTSNKGFGISMGILVAFGVSVVAWTLWSDYQRSARDILVECITSVGSKNPNQTGPTQPESLHNCLLPYMRGNVNVNRTARETLTECVSPDRSFDKQCLDAILADGQAR